MNHKRHKSLLFACLLTLATPQTALANSDHHHQVHSHGSHGLHDHSGRGHATKPHKHDDFEPIAVLETLAVDSTLGFDAGEPLGTDQCPVDPLLDQMPTGLLAYIEGDAPTRLVVFAHGYGQTVEDAWAHHMLRTVRPGVAIVTTNYRDNLGFPVLRGAQDLIAATRQAKQRFGTIDTVYLYGVSMGGAISGTAISESMHVNNGVSLYDYWIAAEGVHHLLQTYTAAAAIGHKAARDIERDTGGSPADCLTAFTRRAPVTRAGEMMTGGLRAAVLIHGVNDGMVNFNQSDEMARAFNAHAIPVQFFRVFGVEDGQDKGDTATGIPPGADAVDDALWLAGHGHERDENHPVIRTAFEQLELMLNGHYDDQTLYLEHIVDDRPPRTPTLP